MTKRIFSIVCALFLLSVLILPAAASAAVDMDRKGSISLTMTCDGKAVPGGTLTIYRVAEVRHDNGDYSFRYLQTYADCKVPVNDPSSAKIAEALAKLVKEKKLRGTTATIDNRGRVRFPNLEVGLYLVIQEKPASGYSPVNPFMVSVPGQENGSYDYDVDASPKLELEKEPTAPTKPSTEPTKPSSDKLPQTGQTSWPIPILAIGGLLLLVTGGYLCASDKRKSHET